MKNSKNPRIRKDGIVVQEMNGEVLVYDLQTNKAFCLNETSSLIWQACDGEKSVEEIAVWLGRKLGQKVNEDLIWLALDQFSKEKLITEEVKLIEKFQGETRREVIKKIGMASLTTLPVILALNAPVAAQTASACAPPTGRPVGCTCSGNGNCASNCCRGTTCVSGPPCN